MTIVVILTSISSEDHPHDIPPRPKPDEPRNFLKLHHGQVFSIGSPQSSHLYNMIRSIFIGSKQQPINYHKSPKRETKEVIENEKDPKLIWIFAQSNISGASNCPEDSCTQ